MEKKYIIELPEKCITERDNGSKYLQIHVADSNRELTIRSTMPLTPYTEPDTEAIEKEAYQKGYCDALAKHCPICEEKKDAEEAYQRGLDDAWEAAKKIYLPEDHGGLGYKMRMKVFDTDNIGWIFKNLSASKAIEKFHTFEEKKREEQEIKAGDEVITASWKAVVTGVGPVHFEYVYADGSHGYDKVKNVTKTGRHFPELAEILKKMREPE